MKNLLIFFFVLSSFGFAQTKTNLDLFFELENQFEAEYQKKYPTIKRFFNFENDDKYVVLYNRLKKSDSLNSIGGGLLITIDTAYTEYTNLYREGIFGEYYLVRQVNLKMDFPFSYIIKKEYSVKDTVLLSKKDYVEDASLFYTRAKIPTEPFWQSFFEPAIVVLTSIAIIFLLFITRS